MIFTCMIKRFLDFSFNLTPMSISHGRILKILDKWHSSLELLNATFDGITDVPILVLKNINHDLICCQSCNPWLATHIKTKLPLPT